MQSTPAKTILITILTVVVVLFLGYIVLKNDTVLNPITQNSATNTAPTNTVPTQNTTQQPPAPISVLGLPIAETGTSVRPSNSTAIVSGRVTPKGAPTTYWYDYGLTTAVNNRTSTQGIGSGFGAIDAPGYILGLKANTQYYFRLSAENKFGVSHGAVYSFTTDNTAPVPGVAPTVQTNSATEIARTSVKLNGNANPRGHETRYWFEFGETNSFGSITTFGSAGNSQVLTPVSAIISGLKPLTKYYYRLDAQNQYGTVTGGTQSFTTAGPGAPNLPVVMTNSATNIATSSVTFNGNLDPRGADTTYWFEYSKDSDLANIIGTATAEQFMRGPDSAIGVKADVSGLSKKTQYFFRLLAKNQYGTVTGSVMSFRTK